MDSIEYWDKVAKEKTFTTPFQLELFKEYVGKDKKVVDIGCGYGRILKELFDNGYTNLLGIDFSNEMIKLAKEKYSYINFKVANGKNLEFENNSIDSIILFAVLTTIYDSKSQQDLIKEVYRVLKKDGILYVNDFLLNDSDLYLKRYNKYKNIYHEYGVFESSDGGVFKHHSEEYFNELLSDFKCEKEKVLKFKTINGHTSNGVYYLGRKRG